MPSEAAVCEAVTTLLARLAECAVTRDVRGMLDYMRELNAQPIGLPVLQRTKCGIAIAKLRNDSDAELGALATALVKKWKRVAEEAGVAAAPKRSPAPIISGAAASMPLVNSIRGTTNAEVTIGSASDAPTAAVAVPLPASTAADSLANTAQRRVPTPPTAVSAPTLPSLPSSRAKPRQIFMDLIVKAVLEHVGVRDGAVSTLSTVVEDVSASPSAQSDPVAPPLQELAEVRAQAGGVACALEAALFHAVGGASPERPSPAYIEQFRVLALGLPRNPPMTLALYSSLLPLDAVVRMTSDELASDATRERTLLLRKEACVR